ncbi:MAG TPA: MBL fold metallo-hydrolase [Propionibacteriaceae bacterium]|nr:MBL fold metallo-hydrolase [Propionibacteriaceae bacterium]
MTDLPPVVEPAATPALGPWRELRSGVYLAVAEPESVNLGVIVGSQRIMLVDTGSSPEQGRTLRTSLAAITDKPLSAVVVTHWHAGHGFGLVAFAGIQGIAHESVRLRLSSPEAATEAERMGFQPDELGRPDVEVAVATAIDLGDRRVEIVHIGRGHTDGDLVVVVPDADLLFAGDLINSAGPPALGPDSVPEEWPATLDGVIGLMTATTLAIPGHGEPVDREFVFEQRSRIAAEAAARTRPPGPQLPLA